MKETIPININPDNTHPTWEDFYLGSRKFQFLADAMGLPIDQINFLLGQFLALVVAYLFRILLHPSNVSATTRRWTALSAGLCISYFCFGKQILLAICLVIICYCVILFFPFTTFHYVTLCVSMMYLSAVHIQRLFYEDGHFVIDITGPLMIIVQKTTSLAYSLHDGLMKDKKDLTELQKNFVIRSKPSALEYFSYLLCFQSILAGPFFMFTDYQDFIEGTQYLKYEVMRKQKLEEDTKATFGEREIANNNYQNGKCTTLTAVHEPNPMPAAIKKIIISLMCALMAMTVLPMVPNSYITEKSFLAKSSLYKMSYLVMTTSMARQLYYTGWFLADAVCCMSGLGFSGYSEDGVAKWDLVGNVDIVAFEFGTSLKSTLEAWNIGTMKWLRFLVYERAPMFKTLLTYLLSSIWHGFYLGYYLTFLGGALFTMAARTVRRCVRPRVISKGPFALGGYHVVTWFMTRLTLGYITFPFVILKFWESLYIYSSLWFYLHILAFLMVIFLPLIIPPPKRDMASLCKEN